MAITDPHPLRPPFMDYYSHNLLALYYNYYIDVNILL